MRRALLTVSLVPAVLVAGCNLVGGGPGGTGGTIQGVRWLLTSYDVDGTATPVPAGVTADATFEAGTVTGSGGCNTYNASYKLNGAKIEIGEIQSTLIACEAPAGDVESAYFANLRRSGSYTATAATLTMFDGSGRAILEFAAGPANPLIGSWDVTGYNNGQAVTSPLPGTALTATFGKAGLLNGSSGCNTYNGSYTVTDGTLAIGPLSTTRMACEEAIMTQETQFLAALAGSTRFRINGDVVTLVLPSDAIGVTLVPSA